MSAVEGKAAGGLVMADVMKTEMLHMGRERQMISRDPLTGLANRTAIESQISQTMQSGGALFVCDVDYFNRINDKFGHLKGDACLQKAAELLSHIVRQQDALGRIGGDEFVIFAYGSQTEKTVEIIRNKILKCFQSYSLSGEIPLTMTVGAAIYREGDTFQALFERADRQLQELKQRKHVGRDFDGGVSNPWVHDLKMIRTELAEQVTASSGASCEDFESFKQIYRYLERSMRRRSQQSCIVLLSLADEDGETCALANIRKYMGNLKDILLRNLRLGDMFTQYSSCQYLVLLTDVDKPTAEQIMQRLKNCFSEEIGNPPEDQLLLYYSYESEPIGTI